MPKRGGVADHVRADMAEICRTCLVRVECAAYAAAEPTLVGVWAGTTAEQRRRPRCANAHCPDDATAAKAARCLACYMFRYRTGRDRERRAAA